MKVSSRLQTHPGFTTPPAFVEMRYFHCGDYSFLTAVIFALLEQAALPHETRLRASIRKSLGESQSTEKKLIEMTIDAKVPEDDVRTAWHWASERAVPYFLQIALGAQLTDYSQLYGFLSSVGFEALQSKEERRANMALKQIYWVADGSSVIVLYKHYAMQSFAVSPTCGHLHLRYALFRRVKEIAQRPLSEREFQGLDLVCGVNSCQVKISDFAFKLAVEATRESTERAALIRAALWETGTVEDLHRKDEPGSCRCCMKTECSSLCGKEGCVCCLNCAVVATFTQIGLRCPVCGDRLTEESLDKVLKETQKYHDIQSPQLPSCDLCRIEMPLEEFTSIRILSHKCWICNECLVKSEIRSLESASCPCCLEPFLPLSASEEQAQKEESKGEQDILLCKICTKPKKLLQFKCFLQGGHKCFVCDACFEAMLNHSAMPSCVICRYEFQSYEVSQYQDILTKGEVSSIHCLQCGIKKNLGEYACSSTVSHWWQCKVCDSCLLKPQGSKSCIVCFMPYSEADLLKLLENVDRIHSDALPEAEVPTRSESVNCQTKRCALCSTEKISSEFQLDDKHQCQICDLCFKRKVQRLQRCPLCSISFSSLPLSDTVTCEKCKASFQSCNYLSFSRLEHSCKVCNNCLQARTQVNICPHCNHPYSEKDVLTLSDQAEETKKQIAVGVCSCGQDSTKGKITCIKHCCCSYCLLKYFFFTGKRSCPKCSFPCQGNYPWSVKCSGCLDGITMDKSERHKLAGVCSQGCLLCICCVLVEKGHLKCSVCRAEVDGDTVEAVSEAQKKFILACRCENAAGKQETTKCGHQIHIQCKYITYSCRICRESLKSRLESINIRQFLK